MSTAALPVPDFMIKVNTQFFHYGKDHQAADHDAGCVPAYPLQVAQREVTAPRGEPEPKLTDEDKTDTGQNTDVYCLICILFAMVFTENIRGQKGGGEENVPQGLVETKGGDLCLYFNVGNY